MQLVDGNLNPHFLKFHITWRNIPVPVVLKFSLLSLSAKKCFAFFHLLNSVANIQFV